MMSVLLSLSLSLSLSLDSQKHGSLPASRSGPVRCRAPPPHDKNRPTPIRPPLLPCPPPTTPGRFTTGLHAPPRPSVDQPTRRHTSSSLLLPPHHPINSRNGTADHRTAKLIHYQPSPSGPRASSLLVSTPRHDHRSTSPPTDTPRQFTTASPPPTSSRHGTATTDPQPLIHYQPSPSGTRTSSLLAATPRHDHRSNSPPTDTHGSSLLHPHHPVCSNPDTPTPCHRTP